MDSSGLRIHAVRLKPGQDLKQEIETYAQNENIEAGWIVTCVGSLTGAHIRFANQRSGVKLNGYFEIVSLTGTVSINGSHIHISISDEEGKTFGGHLLAENSIYTTAEIIIGGSKELIFTRKEDSATGWKELEIKRKS